jgi:hypothetical protein
MHSSQFHRPGSQARLPRHDAPGSCRSINFTSTPRP